MAIEKSEICLMAGCVVATVVFLFIVTGGGTLFSLFFGTVCGIGGGGLGCLFRRWMARNAPAEQTDQDDTEESAPPP